MSAAADRRSPAAVLREHGLRAKKSWGQCFLHDARVIAAIAEASGAGPRDVVVEIGAGLGTLTRALADRAGTVIAIERDRDLAAVLREELRELPNVQLLEEDALAFSFARFDEPVLVVGNLPYNISSPILFHLLAAAPHIRAATIMLQRELAERILAAPGSRTYGAPSVLCQQRAVIERCLRVGRGAFVPAPRVDSTVIRLRMRDPRYAATPPLFGEVVHAAFGQRRKTLARALTARFEAPRVRDALAHAAIDGQLRAEVLDVASYVALARAFELG